MSLHEKLAVLPGRVATRSELDTLQALMPGIPEVVIELFARFPLVGVSFSLSEECDESELGAEFRLLSAAEIVDEATAVYPGIAALKLGYLPVATCLEGMGDPYFIRCPSGECVRIPHDSVVGEDGLDETQVDVVAKSLELVLELAEPYPAGRSYFPPGTTT